MRKVFAAGFCSFAILMAGWSLFDRDQDRREAVDQLVPLLRLQPGNSVADIGAGNGEWSVELTRVVGPQGHVFATEVDSNRIDSIRRRAQRAGLSNVTAVMGTQDSTGLDGACCQAILLRNVYHHFANPAAMNRGMLEALVPGGRIAVIDFLPDRSLSMGSIPKNRSSHGMHPETIIEEMTAGGFHLVERIDRWQKKKDWYLILFERPGE